MIQTILCLLVAIPACCSTPGKVIHTWESPSKSIKAEAYFVDPDKPRKIYIFNTNSPDIKEVLCEFERDADVIFSPDEKRIAVNDFLGSDTAEIRIFQLENHHKYRETERELNNKCWKLLQKKHRVPFPKGLDHRYCRIVQWSPDSTALLVTIWGHTDSNSHITDWLCVYDLRSHKASTDLSAMNKQAVVYRAK